MAMTEQDRCLACRTLRNRLKRPARKHPCREQSSRMISARSDLSGLTAPMSASVPRCPTKRRGRLHSRIALTSSAASNDVMLQATRVLQHTHNMIRGGSHPLNRRELGNRSKVATCKEEHVGVFDGT
jgi:hypothetical protein